MSVGGFHGNEDRQKWADGAVSVSGNHLGSEKVTGKIMITLCKQIKS